MPCVQGQRHLFGFINASVLPVDQARQQLEPLLGGLRFPGLERFEGQHQAHVFLHLAVD